MKSWKAWVLIAGLVCLMPAAYGNDAAVPLVSGGRTIHVFRAALGDISAQERAEAAQVHIDKVLERNGEGWTSIAPTDNGVIVSLDGQPMFTVLTGDARTAAGETAEALANQASRTLQKVWSEAREHRDPEINGTALLKVLVALAILALVLAAAVKISQVSHRRVRRHLIDRLGNEAVGGLGSRFSEMLLRFTTASATVLTWLLGLVAVTAFALYSLEQFAVTRPLSESLLHLARDKVYEVLRSAAYALPGLFVALAIFLVARVATQISRAVFDHIVAGRLQFGALDAHTAPATRHLVNAAIWLFALAMAYPYLPGSQTEAFKGLSLLLGLMVSIGASGPVGQVASGMILAFTRALKVGDYVRIQDCEGTVTHLGLYVTRLRTGSNEEISLPNSLVISQVTHNFSRNVNQGGFVLDPGVTIGYDTPWRQVHAMLLEAAAQIPEVRRDPPPFVMQTALSDFYVEYRLVAQVGAEAAAIRPRVMSTLLAAIQDVFNAHGVQIMSPHYLGDPEQPKVVPPQRWHGDTGGGGADRPAP